MSVEDRLRTATRARANLVSDIRPLELPARERVRRPRASGTRRWVTWAAPVTAAAVVVALAVTLVSLRQLHKLFHASGTSVAGWIRQRRLEHCGHDLRDPRCAARSVAAVGARWGYPDPAHFSRLFKAAYGVGPRDYESGSPHACCRFLGHVAS